MKAIVSSLVLILLLAAGCRSRSGDEAVLPPEKMQALLWDMMRADQFISDFVISKDSSRKREPESRAIYPQILQWHRVTATQFRRSLDFYRDHPEKLRPIMDSLSLPPRSVLSGPEAAPTQPIKPVEDVPAATPAPVNIRKDTLRRPLRNRDTLSY